MRDPKSLLLVLLCIGLVSTWIYHIYDKTTYSQRQTQVFTKDSAAVAQAIRDSLDRLYSGTITDLDTRLSYSRLNEDSLRNSLDNKLSEINQLKSEISNILNKQGFSKTDMVSARQKIGKLQEKVDELSGQNLTMEQEKKELTGILEQLSGDVDTLQRNIRRLSNENRQLNEKIARKHQAILAQCTDVLVHLQTLHIPGLVELFAHVRITHRPLQTKNLYRLGNRAVRRQ